MALIDRLPPRWKFRALAARHGGDVAARALGVTVGEGCRILSCTVASEHWLVSIGDRVTVSTDVQFITHDGTGWLVVDDRGRRYRYARISVGSDVFIGASSIIMPGVRIGDRCVIAAGSVVTRSVPDGSVVGGNPARIIGDYDELEARIAKTWPTETDRHGPSYRAAVDRIVDDGFKPELQRQGEAS